MKKVINMKSILIAGILAGGLVLAGCKSEKNEPDYTNTLIYLATNKTPSTEEQNCLDAMFQMNRCISGTGFLAQEMCGAAHMATMTSSAAAATPADATPYATLKTCVTGVIGTTSCYLTVNMSAGAVDAKNNRFSSCDVPKGILKTAL